jgi:hypothetical protein
VDALSDFRKKRLLLIRPSTQLNRNRPLVCAELLILEDRPNELHRVEVAAPQKCKTVVIVQSHVAFRPIRPKPSERDLLTGVSQRFVRGHKWRWRSILGHGIVPTPHRLVRQINDVQGSTFRRKNVLKSFAS